jgi:S-(hydroxymethyl)glutathione dehydrogenase / alcohol dehydrogenase
MKAAVCYEAGKPLVVEDIDLDPQQQGEVKVRLAATAICQSDVHSIRGDWPGNLPMVVGHEDELITAHSRVAQLNEAIEAMERGEALRNVILWV